MNVPCSYITKGAQNYQNDIRIGGEFVALKGMRSVQNAVCN